MMTETRSSEDPESSACFLSAVALQALQEFYVEQMSAESENTPENWQLSQFWYSDETAQVLAKAALHAAGDSGTIACVSCPTVYKQLLALRPTTRAIFYLLEYDRRFSSYANFVYYDFNEPLEVSEALRGACDVVVADPPFLSQECLEKTAQTIRLIAKDKIILCTGAVMQEQVRQFLGLTPAQFRPKHARNLANEFLCYSNFSFDCEQHS